MAEEMIAGNDRGLPMRAIAPALTMSMRSEAAAHG